MQNGVLASLCIFLSKLFVRIFPYWVSIHNWVSLVNCLSLVSILSSVLIPQTKESAHYFLISTL